MREISGPVDGDALQHVSSAADHRQRGAGRQLRPGDRADARTLVADANCRRVDAAGVDRAGLLQMQAGNTAMFVFVLAVVFVFLVLAAQYESWSLPLAVILVVPMCLLCSIAGVAGRRAWTSTSSRRSASWCWSAWRARTRS